MALNLHLSASDSSSWLIMTLWWLHDDFMMTSWWLHDGIRLHTTAQACRLLFSSSQLMPASLFSCTDTRQNNLITRLCFICYTVHNFCCFLPAWYSQNTCRHNTTGEDSNKSKSLSCCVQLWGSDLWSYIKNKQCQWFKNIWQKLSLYSCPCLKLTRQLSKQCLVSQRFSTRSVCFIIYLNIYPWYLAIIYILLLITDGLARGSEGRRSPHRISARD